MIPHKHMLRLRLDPKGDRVYVWQCESCKLHWAAYRSHFWVNGTSVQTVFYQWTHSFDSYKYYLQPDDDEAFVMDKPIVSFTEDNLPGWMFDVEPMIKPELPWVKIFGRRCRAVLEANDKDGYFGQCELIRKHPQDMDHALERGFDTPRWSTQRTD